MYIHVTAVQYRKDNSDIEITEHCFSEKLVWNISKITLPKPRKKMQRAKVTAANLKISIF